MNDPMQDRRGEVLARVYRRGSALRARRRMTYGGVAVALLAILAVPSSRLLAPAADRHGLTSDPATPAPGESVSPSETESPSPTPTVSATQPVVTIGPPSPTATGTALRDCTATDVTATLTPNKTSYVWGSDEPGDPPRETVDLDASFTNRGPDCMWFNSVGYEFALVKAQPGNYAANRYGQCIAFPGQRRDVFVHGATRTWTYPWDQLCLVPTYTGHRFGVAPGDYLVSMWVVWGNSTDCVDGRECLGDGAQAIVGDATLSLVDIRSPSPSPSDSPTATPTESPSPSAS